MKEITNRLVANAAGAVVGIGMTASVVFAIAQAGSNEIIEKPVLSAGQTERGCQVETASKVFVPGAYKIVCPK